MKGKFAGLPSNMFYFYSSESGSKLWLRESVFPALEACRAFPDDEGSQDPSHRLQMNSRTRGDYFTVTVTSIKLV